MPFGESTPETRRVVEPLTRRLQRPMGMPVPPSWSRCWRAPRRLEGLAPDYRQRVEAYAAQARARSRAPRPVCRRRRRRRPACARGPRPPLGLLRPLQGAVGGHRRRGRRGERRGACPARRSVVGLRPPSPVHGRSPRWDHPPKALPSGTAAVGTPSRRGPSWPSSRHSFSRCSASSVTSPRRSSAAGVSGAAGGRPRPRSHTKKMRVGPVQPASSSSAARRLTTSTPKRWERWDRRGISRGDARKCVGTGGREISHCSHQSLLSVNKNYDSEEEALPERSYVTSCAAVKEGKGWEQWVRPVNPCRA